MRIRLIGLLASLAGCASSGFPDVVDVRDVSTTFGPPSISHIRDAGAVHLPNAGAWKGEPDGIAGPGELLVIEGDNFGRLPTVSIGGRATTVVARTEGGGIVARVPTGVPVGQRVDRRLAAQGARGEDVPHPPLRRRRPRRSAPLPARRQGSRRARRQAAPRAGRARRAHLLATAPPLTSSSTAPTATTWSPSICARRAARRRRRARSSRTTARSSPPPWTRRSPPSSATARSPWSRRATRAAPRAVRADGSADGRQGRRARLSSRPTASCSPCSCAEGNRLVAIDVSSPPNANVVTAVDLLPDRAAAAGARSGLRLRRRDLVDRLGRQRPEPAGAAADAPDRGAHPAAGAAAAAGRPAAAPPRRGRRGRSQTAHRLGLAHAVGARRRGAAARRRGPRAAAGVGDHHPHAAREGGGVRHRAATTRSSSSPTSRSTRPPAPRPWPSCGIRRSRAWSCAPTSTAAAARSSPPSSSSPRSTSRPTRSSWSPPRRACRRRRPTGGVVLDFGVTFAPIWGATITPVVRLARKDRRQGAQAAVPHRRRPHPALSLRLGLRLAELAFPARHDHGRQAVADDVHRRARHVHELVDAEDDA